ncbi:hypothetical protein CHS0354_020537 [Potamilus streckersoni]|uniref:SH2 domain-containing protein n=1 Tax=Potamilus streckersoni TaxID=2493646 RepID=A0AAE0WD54_9BIVA|nr:hypothetical protein CHS0354_020537 [Potamilus streckersoni]
MEAEFDPHDKASWYFGPLNREETNNILMKARENGTFLVRDSQSIKGDFVLSIKQDSNVNHYIINKIQAVGNFQYRIGDQQFPDMATLLQFYKSHHLNTTALVKVAPKTTEKVIASYVFAGQVLTHASFIGGNGDPSLCVKKNSTAFSEMYFVKLSIKLGEGI